MISRGGYALPDRQLRGLMADYARSYGLHHFELSTGETISVISAPDWDRYWRVLQENACGLSGIVLSPELITSQFEFDDVAFSQNVIEQRVGCVIDLSADTPDVVYALGTPVFDRGVSRPTNSLLFISRGAVVARKNKAYMHPNTHESRTFRTDAYLGPNSLNTRMASLVCADLVNAAYLQPKRKPGTFNYGKNRDLSIGSQTETVIMSACWSMPLTRGVWTMASVLPDEQRYTSQLEGAVSRLFNRHPRLTDLVVADRVSGGSRILGPLNVHYSRA